MKSRWPFLIIFGVFIVLLTIGSFYDFQISNAVFVKDNGFVTFMASLGEYPAYSLITFCGGFIIGSGFKHYRKKSGNYILIFLGLIAFGLGFYYQGKAITSVNGYNMENMRWIIGMPISFAIISPMVMLGCFAAFKNPDRNLWKTAVAVASTLGIAIIIVTVIKAIPHRPRFRFLVQGHSELFKNWWEPFEEYKNYIVGDITSEEFKSFPSGHTANACVLLCLPYIVDFIGIKNEKIRTGSFYVGFAYVLLLAFTRIQCGGHFLSDISMGALVSTACMFITNEIIQKYLLKQC